MKRFYRCRFGFLQETLAPRETLQNGHRTSEECYLSSSYSLQIGVEEAPFCDQAHALGRAILGIAANGSNLDVRHDVIPIDATRLSFAFSLEKDLDDAKIDLGFVCRMHWADRGDDRLFITSTLTPREIVIARPALRTDDEPACKHCGSRRMFCAECLAFRGSCSDCGGVLTRSDLYRRVSDSRKRRGLPDLVLYDECIVADDAAYDVAASAAVRGSSAPSVYYSERLLDFVRDRVGCQIAVTEMDTHTRAEYREILEAIGAT